MNEEHIILSESPEDLRKAVEWGREQKKMIMNEKSQQLADALMEKLTPLILQRKLDNK